MEQTVLSINDDKMTTRGELIEYPAELIGGRNLLTNIIDNWERGSYTGGSLSDFSSNSRIRTDFVEVEPSTQYIISFNSDYDVWIPELDASKVGVAQTYAVYWDSGHIFTTTSETKYLHICFRIKGSSYSSTNPEYFVYPEDIVEIKPKLEKGTIATPWTPAPEDLGLSYPNWVTEFKPSISENGILIGSFTENPNL